MPSSSTWTGWLPLPDRHLVRPERRRLAGVLQHERVVDGLDRSGPPPPTPSGPTVRPREASSATTTGVLSGTVTSSQQNTSGALRSLASTDPNSRTSQLQSGADLGSTMQEQGVTADQLPPGSAEDLLVDAQV